MNNIKGPRLLRMNNGFYVKKLDYQYMLSICAVLPRLLADGQQRSLDIADVNEKVSYGKPHNIK